jgi:hypothetical protein
MIKKLSKIRQIFASGSWNIVKGSAVNEAAQSVP